MNIQLQMAGTGNAFAKTYFNNNALIYREGFILMIDFGSTAPLALHRMNIPLNRPDGILITHLHADHIGGIEELAFQLKYAYKKKTKLFIADTLADTLWEHSLKAGLYNEDEDCTSLYDYFDVVTLKEGTIASVLPGIKVELVRTEHIPTKTSYSLFIHHDIFYSADMKFNRELIEHAVLERKCRVILHDCQLNGPGLVHATLDQLLTLPEDVQSVIRLMHYDDNMEQFIGKTGRMTFLEQHKIYDL